MFVVTVINTELIICPESINSDVQDDNLKRLDCVYVSRTFYKTAQV